MELSDEQKKRIEESRLAAIERKKSSEAEKNKLRVYSNPWNSTVVTNNSSSSSSNNTMGFVSHSMWNQSLEKNTKDVLGTLKDRVKKRQNIANAWKCHDMRTPIGIEVSSWIKPAKKQDSYYNDDDEYSYQPINYGSQID